MQTVDTNIILRYMLNNDEKLSPYAKDIIDNNTIVVFTEVLCEVVYVLTNVYKVPREKLALNLKEFIESTGCILVHKGAISVGIEYFGKTKLDFVDCLLAGYNEVENIVLHTFDKDLIKLSNAKKAEKKSQIK
ncbi:MAG: PIN domain-containing protein [Elusimicrobiota bacterium]|jgi:predicted nucleic-acid-binding protein|nr:PIN domain-containing protein [Elusimicrobiota bacterium]